MIELQLYSRHEQDIALELISGFWLCHSNYRQTPQETLKDLTAWTRVGHTLYFILLDKKKVGFIHLGSRGGEIDWLEDIFVLPQFQGQGIGTRAIVLAEEIVSQYSVSMYIEAAARNAAAIRLYQRLGYTCLNTISVRKDFAGYEYDIVKKEKLYDLDFEIRKDKQQEE